MKNKKFSRIGNLGLTLLPVLGLIIGLFLITGLALAGSDSEGARGGTTDYTPPQLDPADLTEGFDDITVLPGWFMQNNSQPVGTTSWFQGNDTVFPAQGGAPTSYIGANFNNTTGGSGTISNWLLTPVLNLNDGDTVSFWTRTADGSIWADRLELRMSTAGASTNVGTLATDVGDFTTVLTSVNPSQIGTGYPQVWTEFVVTISGVPVATDGRLAFRYFVTSAGPSGSNSNYIGIDSFNFTDAEPPVAPSIALTKTVGVNAGVCATTDTITVPGAGADVYYCYEVMNTGDVTLTLHDLVDSELGNLLTGFPYALAPGASVDSVAAGLEFSATITQTTVNTATWTAFNNSQETASASATATVNVSTVPTSVSLTGFGDSGKAATPYLFGALALLVLGFGFVIRRKLTA